MQRSKIVHMSAVAGIPEVEGRKGKETGERKRMQRRERRAGTDQLETEQHRFKTHCNLSPVAL